MKKTVLLFVFIILCSLLTALDLQQVRQKFDGFAKEYIHRQFNQNQRVEYPLYMYVDLPAMTSIVVVMDFQGHDYAQYQQLVDGVWTTTTEMRGTFTDGHISSFAFSTYEDGAAYTMNIACTWSGDNLVRTVQTVNYSGMELTLGQDDLTYSGSILTGISEQTLDYQSMALVPYARYTLSWSGSQLNEVLTEERETSGWVNSRKQTLAYNRIVPVQVVSFDYDNGWVNSNRDSYTFTGNGQVQTITSEEYMDGQWVNQDKNELFYNGTHEDHENNYTWIDNAWTLTNRFLFYFLNDMMTTQIEQELQEGVWVDTEHIYYTEGTAAHDVTAATRPSLSIYPNPFNPRALVNFDLPMAGAVQLKVYDARGRLVNTLVNGTLNAGSHQVQWNGTDTHGKTMPSGVYFARLHTVKGNVSHKMLMLK